MSEVNIYKSKKIKCKTKSKKRFLFDLEKIENEYYSRSCDKNEKNTTKNNNKMELTKNKIYVIKRIEDLKRFPLKNIQYIFSAWKSSNLINEVFEKKIINNSDFEINFENFEIKTKSEKASEELKDEKFWILFLEYLIKNNKIKTGNDFLKAINNAFSYLNFDCKLLTVYFLEKIKIFHPIAVGGGTEDKDGPYIELLDTPVKNRINNIKENLSSNIKLKNISSKSKNAHYFYEYTPTPQKKKK